MPTNERIVSPGVFTKEIDQTFLATGVSEIGAAIIGPFEKGPAFVPTAIASQNEAFTVYGKGTYYTPYTLQNYLKSAGQVFVLRVLGLSGYTTNMGVILDSNDTILAVVAPTTQAPNYDFGDFDINGSASSFVLTANSSSYSASFDSSTSTYVTDIFGESALGTKDIYIYANFPTKQAITSGAVTQSAVVNTASFGGYSAASTPNIVSQTVGGEQHNLFTIETISDGLSANSEIKVGIFDVKLASENPNSDYGSFGIVVRQFTDTDSRALALETYSNLTLDPDSINYLPRVIGDKKPQFDSDNVITYTGEWTNKSKYIRIQMDSNVDKLPKAVVPFGFAAYNEVMVPGSGSFPTMSFDTTQTINNETNTRGYYGIDLDDADTKAKLIATPNTTTTGSNLGFNLEDYVSGGTGSIENRKFMVAFQGGNDGLDPRNSLAQGEDITSGNSQGFVLSGSATDGTLAYARALDTLANPDEIDINLIVTPGIISSLHSSTANKAIDTCESRGDCFYLMDSAQITDSVQNAIDNVVSLDTSYAATYFPWVRILDPNSTKPLWVPPSVVLAGVYSFNDRVAQEWFAPAGLTRGGISEAIEAFKRLSHTDRDNLYEGRVNPLATFPNTGVVAWGQKTLQVAASALDRVNVRRLLITVKKFIASATRFLVFEQNVAATRNRFLNITNPYLESVRQQAGLFAFKVVMDESINPPDVIDRNQLVGQIFLQPTRTAEFILLDFSILPTGATFPE